MGGVRQSCDCPVDTVQRAIRRTLSAMLTPSRSEFIGLVRRHAVAGVRLAIPVGLRLMGDQLTPVLAYRRLVVNDERTAPSFLFESVEGGERVGRYSIMGSRPSIEVVAREHAVTIRDRRHSGRGTRRVTDEDPLLLLRELTSGLAPIALEGSAAMRLPATALGGWVGYASYDTVRYTEPGKLSFASAPRDDRGLPDLHFGFYPRLVVFDHVETLVHVVESVEVGPGDDAGACYDRAAAELERTAGELQTHSKPLVSGAFEAETGPRRELASNLTRAEHAAMVARAKEYIRAGDVFQVVLGQRFERRSAADPFDVYRALRAVNPSPYMGYLQCEGCILVASSPEILCQVRATGGRPRSSVSAASTDCPERQSVARDRVFTVTNRPLAGTRPRGGTPEEDAALERELLADEKERAEHIMLVDLGRNDVGRVAAPGTIRTPSLMAIERYSHVMHISSTVEGELAAEFDCWDALRAALPVGTISGAPKVRAMQIIQDLEPSARGLYAGAVGYLDFAGNLDFCIAIRTVIMSCGKAYVQAGAGIVMDSNPAAEYEETRDKARALVRALELAQQGL